MRQAKHNYRVNLYLGKENYEELQKIADKLMIPMTTLCKIIFATGFEMSKMVEKGAKNGGK